MAPTKYHRFRHGERCDECGARQWYAQDAIRYCRNGHRLEGFAEHEGDEDAFGTQGRVSRRKKEARKKVAVKLTGDEGRELYLEVLQLILRKQVRWLVQEKGFPGDFEEIVRALWTLRVRNLPLQESGGEKKRRKGGGDEWEQDGYPSSAESTLFSSQSDGAGFESSDFDHSDATTATWAPDASKRWKLPKLFDTLALCYLACLVRRLPATTADFCSWAQKGEIDFLAALNGIPQNVRDRLPAEYHRALQVRDHIPLGKLQTTVQDLVISFKANFDTVFPPLNYVPILVRLMTDLTLPIETYLAVKCITKILKADYSYPIGGKRIRTIDNPEVFLTAVLVVSAKLLYPLDNIERPPRSDEDPRNVKVNWAQWQESMREETNETSPNLLRGEEYKVTAEDVLGLDKTKLDDYMDWFEKMWIRDGDAKTDERIQKPFLGQDRLSVPSNNNEELSQDQEIERIRNRYAALNSSMIIVEPVADPEDTEVKKEKQPRDFCPVWRTQEDLPDAARALYSKAASLAAIPLNTLVRGATQIERRLEVWCSQQASKQRDKGKGKAVWTGDDDVED
ncbi:Vacuolar protein sorting-associated protein 52 [Hypoxylon texense]